MDAPAMRQTTIDIPTGGTTIKGIINHGSEDKNDVGIFICAGGARISQTTDYFPPLCRAFARAGITNFTFDYRGVGETDALHYQTSLNTRIQDAEAAFAALLIQSPVKRWYFYGVSMGAPVVLELTRNRPSAGLILVSPAAYGPQTRDKLFGPGFKSAAQNNNGWEHSPEFRNLEAYQGQILLAYTPTDAIVMEDIRQRYLGILATKQATILKLDGASHGFFRVPGEVNDAAMKKFLKAVIEFVS